MRLHCSSGGCLHRPPQAADHLSKEAPWVHHAAPQRGGQRGGMSRAHSKAGHCRVAMPCDLGMGPGRNAQMKVLARRRSTSFWVAAALLVLTILALTLRADGVERRPARRRVQQCNFEAGGPFAQQCLRLTNVCVDQNTIVLYDDKYQQARWFGSRRSGAAAAPSAGPCLL